MRKKPLSPEQASKIYELISNDLQGIYRIANAAHTRGDINSFRILGNIADSVFDSAKPLITDEED